MKTLQLAKTGSLILLGLPLTFIWALTSTGLLVTMAVTSDDPMQIDSQIASIKLLSLNNTYPDLNLIGSIPLDGSTTGRILIADSSIIPSLSTTYFSEEGMAANIHPDNTTPAT